MSRPFGSAAELERRRKRAVRAIPDGHPGDVPLAWDWDGFDQPGIYRVVNGEGFFHLNTGVPGWQPSDRVQKYGGLPGDVPVPGDRDGNGRDDVGIFRAEGAVTYFHLDTGARGWQPTDWVIQYGLVGDHPVVGDWDGGGRDQVGVFRTHDGYGAFHLDVGAGGWQPTDWVAAVGLPVDVPVVGRWRR